MLRCVPILIRFTYRSAALHDCAFSFCYLGSGTLLTDSPLSNPHCTCTILHIIHSFAPFTV